MTTQPLLPLPSLADVLRWPAAVQTSHLAAVLGAGVGGAVRARLPADHPLRPALRQQALDLALRHARIRAELRPLLAAWAAQDIPALLFKGFALAEFEYATPGERFYGDVDILLPEDLNVVMRAAHIAMAHGWRSDGQHADPTAWTHETMHLYSPGGNVKIDVHRWVVARSTAAGEARLRELTAGVWQRAALLDWDGVSIVRPSPLDAAIVHLALGRCWGGDSGGLKPADYLDLQLLQQNHALEAGALWQHARHLGTAGTWEAYREVCDPLRERLQLERSQTAPVLAAGLAKDGLSLRQGLWHSRVQTLRRTWPLLLPALGDVIAAWWAVGRGGDPRTWLRRWTPAGPTRRLSVPQINARLLAVGLWTRLLYPQQRRRGVCVPRAYASYRLLRRAGHPAVFVSGAGRSGGAFVAHAWVEDDQGNLEGYGEPLNRQRFKVVFSYPEWP